VFGWYLAFHRWKTQRKFTNYLQPGERVNQSFKARTKLVLGHPVIIAVTDNAMIVSVRSNLIPGLAESGRVPRVRLGPVSRRFTVAKITPAMGPDGTQFQMWVPGVFVPAIKAADADLAAGAGGPTV
jgi:hypothetical protein